MYEQEQTNNQSQNFNSTVNSSADEHQQTTGSTTIQQFYSSVPSQNMQAYQNSLKQDQPMYANYYYQHQQQLDPQYNYNHYYYNQPPNPYQYNFQNSESLYANYLNGSSQFNQQLQANMMKPPSPSLSTVQPQTELTPEKPVMNDSGIDSPQINQYQAYMSSLYQSQQVQQQSPSTQQIPIMPSEYCAQSNIESNESTNEKQFDETTKEDSDEENDDDSDEDKENDEDDKCKDSKSKMCPSKPPKPYLEIIADAILSCTAKMMQLHEIYNYMEAKYQYFAKNINKSWRNSVRHNLSLNECFVKAGRGSNGKGNYWRIHPLCEKEFIRGNFRRKSFKQLIRAGSSNHQNVHSAFPGAYSLPMDYYRTIPSLIPPPLSQQFTSSSASNLPSFQLPFYSSSLETQPHNQSSSRLAHLQFPYQTESLLSSSKSDVSSIKSSSRFHPYRS
jgi:hypothetical protein